MDGSASAPGSFRVIAELDLPSPPYSPWLRLAHICAYEGGADVRARLRRIADWEFILQLDGEAWIHWGGLGGSVPLRPGDLAIIPPGVLHGQGPERSRHLAVHADWRAQPDLLPMAMLRYTDEQVRRGDADVLPAIRLRGPGGPRILSLVRRLDDPAAWRRRFEPLLPMWALKTLDRPRERLRAAGILAAAFDDLLADGPAVASEPLSGILAAVDVRDRRLRVADLARRAGLGETAFRDAVRRLTGRTPRRWLEERRCEIAQRLLIETGMPVAAVAAAAGYEDPFHFSRVCHRLTGCSPRRLRERAGRGRPSAG